MSRTSPQRGRWPVRRLGDVLIRHNEVVHPGERSGEATFVGLEHIEPNSGRRIGSSTLDLGSLTGRKPTFRRGQIVYAYLRPYLNKVWVADFDGYSSVDQFAFDVWPELADAEYVAAFMRSDTFLRRASIVTTTGQLPRIGIEQIAGVPIQLPPVDVQRRIAGALKEELASARLAMQSSAERLSAAEALPGAFVTAMFRQEASALWPARQLQELVEGSCGQYGTSRRSNRDGRGVAVLGMPNIHQGRIRWENVSTVELPHTEMPKYELAKGDILFNRTNSAELVGKTAVFDGSRPAVFASYLIRYRARTDVADPHFVAAYINSPFGKAYIGRHMARAIGQVNISASTMARMPIPCPPLDEQRVAVSSLRECLAASELLTKRCEDESTAIRTLPAALLRQVFGGH